MFVVVGALLWLSMELVVPAVAPPGAAVEEAEGASADGTDAGGRGREGETSPAAAPAGGERP